MIADRLRAVFSFGPLITQSDLRDLTTLCSAMPAPILMSAGVALRLPSAIQLMQVPMTDGASYMVPVPLSYHA